MNQRTIAKPVSASGNGIHSGLPVNILLLPADSNAGISFVRRPHGRVKANYRNVYQTQFATTLMENDVAIQTVEHFLAAAFGLGITNLTMEMDADELPILDGSSRVWMEKLSSAGIIAQELSYEEIKLKKTIELRNPERETWIKATPSENFEITYHFKLPSGKFQTFHYRFDFNSFQRDIAPARTFCLLSEFERMAQQGFIKGASATTGFILMDRQPSVKHLAALKLYEATDVAILSEEPPRFPNEPVRHKILDIFGDWVLTGRHLKGHIEAYGTGHGENIALIKEIMRD